MSRDEAKRELAKELDGYINEFKLYAKRAGSSGQFYHYAMQIRDLHIPMLCRFAEKYLDIKIEVHETPVRSQYNPGEILGYEIN